MKVDPCKRADAGQKAEKGQILGNSRILRVIPRLLGGILTVKTVE